MNPKHQDKREMGQAIRNVLQVFPGSKVSRKETAKAIRQLRRDVKAGLVPER